MRKMLRFAPVILLAVGFIALLGLLAWGTNVAVLDPKGPIATEQYNLIMIASMLSLIVVIPVFSITFYIVWKYREGSKHKKKAKYDPKLDGNRMYETIWWLIPLTLITVLSVIIWNSSHKLDPYRPLDSDKAPITVQVIALQWKWLFLYPNQGIATVNYVQFPEDTPINFQITADAPMNSFWIPQLGGQVYAMAGMQTKLHLLADEKGEYRGSSANLSGAGFSGMHFMAKATSQADFEAWVKDLKANKKYPALTQPEYDNLALPNTNQPVGYYKDVTEGLYTGVINKYMEPGGQTDANRENTHGSGENH